MSVMNGHPGAVFRDTHDKVINKQTVPAALSE